MTVPSVPALGGIIRFHAGLRHGLRYEQNTDNRIVLPRDTEAHFYGGREGYAPAPFFGADAFSIRLIRKAFEIALNSVRFFFVKPIDSCRRSVPTGKARRFYFCVEERLPLLGQKNLAAIPHNVPIHTSASPLLFSL